MDINDIIPFLSRVENTRCTITSFSKKRQHIIHWFYSIENPTILELLVFFKYRYITRLVDRGFCNVVFNMYKDGYINARDYYILIDYVKSNKPNDTIDDGLNYWYPKEESTRRLNWLNTHINKHLKNGNDL